MSRLQQVTNPTVNIPEPGLAHNVITVGAINDNDTGSNLADDSFYYLTCSGNGGDDGCAKPDLVAPGTLDRYFDSKDNEWKIHVGTSYSTTVIVAGLAAQMMEYDHRASKTARGRSKPSCWPAVTAR